MTSNHPPPHLTRPRTSMVALDGGPRDRQWWPYRDWLAVRASSRRDGYPLDHTWGSSRCYLPTDRHTTNTDPGFPRRTGQARVWQYIPPAQWARWGREYFTPEERGHTPNIPAPRQPQAATTPAVQKQATQPRTTKPDTAVTVPLWTDLEVSP